MRETAFALFILFSYSLLIMSALSSLVGFIFLAALVMPPYSPGGAKPITDPVSSSYILLCSILSDGLSVYWYVISKSLSSAPFIVS